MKTHRIYTFRLSPEKPSQLRCQISATLTSRQPNPGEFNSLKESAVYPSNHQIISLMTSVL